MVAWAPRLPPGQTLICGFTTTRFMLGWLGFDKSFTEFMIYGDCVNPDDTVRYWYSTCTLSDELSLMLQRVYSFITFVLRYSFTDYFSYVLSYRGKIFHHVQIHTVYQTQSLEIGESVEG